MTTYKKPPPPTNVVIAIAAIRSCNSIIATNKTLKKYEVVPIKNYSTVYSTKQSEEDTEKNEIVSEREDPKWMTMTSTVSNKFKKPRS